jgi:hypothetical protein
MKISLCLLAVLFSTGCIQAQNDSTKHRITYFNSLLTGALIGNNEPGSLTASTTHGIRYKAITFGGGVGYDSYRDWRTIPLFASLSWDFLRVKKQNAFFIQCIAGYGKAKHFGRQTDLTNYEVHKATTGLAALGYRIVANRWTLYILTGYKIQHINYTTTARWWPFDVPPIQSKVEQKMERFTLQLGFGLH